MNIKKTLIIFIVLLSFTSKAQHFSNIGLNAGISINDYSDYRGDIKIAINPNLSFRTEFNINNKLVIYTGLVYQRYGVKYIFEASSSVWNYQGYGEHNGYTYIFKSHNISLPILMSFKNNRKFNLLFGTTIEYSILGTTKTIITTKENTEDIKKDISYIAKEVSFYRNSIGFSATIGFKYGFINKDKYKVNLLFTTSIPLNGGGNFHFNTVLGFGVSYKLSNNNNEK